MIRSLFRRTKHVAGERGIGNELGVFTLTLTGVEDLFDPDPLWDRRYGGGAGIAEHLTGDRDFRLQAALDAYRNMVFTRDGAGRFREQNPVFTDVVMWLPAEPWRIDARRGGQRIEAVAQNLAVLHRQKFARSLPEARAPIYTVMPDEGQQDDAVVFQFGFGVFVPSGDDVLEAEITLRGPGSREPAGFRDWSFWHGGAQIKRPVGVYRGQHSLLIVPGTIAPVRAPVWFSRPEGHILLNLNPADSERIYADDDRIQVVETRNPTKEADPIEWVLACRDGSQGDRESEHLAVRITPLARPTRIPDELAAETGPARIGPRSPSLERITGERVVQERIAPQRKPSERIIPERTAPGRMHPERIVPHRARPERMKPKGAGTEEVGREAADSADARKKSTGCAHQDPGHESRAARRSGDTDISRLLSGAPLDRTIDPPLSSRYMLRLVGLALLRIDGAQRIDGLEEWVIWFDEDGWPVPSDGAGTIDIDTCLALSASAADGRLHARNAGARHFEPVTGVPCALPTASGLTLELRPSPIPERYHGLAMLAQEMAFPLSPRPLLLGRSSRRPQSSQPDLPIEILTHPQSLRWERGAGGAGAKLNAVYLSRRHATLTLSGGRLQVSMAEGSAPIFVLDESGRYVSALKPRSTEAVTLAPGEMIVVGSYIFRFHQEKPRTLSTLDYTVAHPGSV